MDAHYGVTAEVEAQLQELARTTPRPYGILYAQLRGYMYAGFTAEKALDFVRRGFPEPHVLNSAIYGPPVRLQLGLERERGRR